MPQSPLCVIWLLGRGGGYTREIRHDLANFRSYSRMERFLGPKNAILGRFDATLSMKNDWSILLYRGGGALFEWVRDPGSTPPQCLPIFHLILGERSEALVGSLVSLSKGVKVLETAVGAVFAPTRFSLVRISIRALVDRQKSLLRNSGVGGGGSKSGLTMHGGL